MKQNMIRFEGLEDRRMMSSTLSPDGALAVRCGTSNDVVNVSSNGYLVFVTENGSSTSFYRSQVKSVSIHGGRGNDSIVVGQAVPSPRVYGGDGNDRLIGGPGNDLLVGGYGNDVVKGAGGNDSMSGNAGNDTLYGQSGNDRIDGHAGDDSIYAWEGNDTVYAGAGNDLLKGEQGNDRLFGEEGFDQILGGSGADYLNGGDGNDSLVGGSGADDMYGMAGDDFIDAARDGSSDKVSGGAGVDHALVDKPRFVIGWFTDPDDRYNEFDVETVGVFKP